MSCTVRLGVLDRAGADWAFVQDLGEQSVMTSVPAFRHPVRALVFAAFDRLLEIVESQSHMLFVAECAEERAGFLIMLDRFPDEITLSPQAFVAYMAVDPARRREGIGAALLAAAEDEARRRGLPYMALMVTEENEAARGLYEQSGFFTERRLLCKHL